ncbi:serine/threonine-protein phosphatase 4 regulatory subunit 1-like isoform X2 [Saccostrea echinata]|uniref:serine/threonine-protein phosphatase 4 regulatory subunit 1-like isoform X2 n=1 Tax=Saccostrea echinata TaxID=191078 RepID=UPI002A7F5861|nr:serine/threonine-protein phosphatase 4 regulatory subunit 1-like isoform X2 [Saccostrea echinata]
MADIEFYSDPGNDGPDDGYGLDDSLEGDDVYNADYKLTPLQKLEKYMQSENVYTRQMVARGLLDTLRAVEETEDDVLPVFNAMVKLSQDSDPIVRSELMEQVPHLAVYCQDNSDIYDRSISSYLLPMVVRYLNDQNNQVRKTSQAALLVLMEQELICKEDIEQQVVGVILDLASPDSLDDYRTEAVALMSKMAPLLGKDMTERLFLLRFCEMCTDPLFHVRKVCAANFGDMCKVVGQDNTEQHLLPKFYYLCEDGVWGVRKACAECFMVVSCSCSQDVRKGELANLFVNLLCDLSRWVRMAAFQQLGPFISTFADPGLTGLYVNEEGILSVQAEQLHNIEKLRELGEKLEHESKQIQASGLTEETDELAEDQSPDNPQSETLSSEVCDTNMDLSETDDTTEIIISTCATKNNPSSDGELSLEEIRAQEYQAKKVDERLAESGSKSDEAGSKKENCDKCDTEETGAPRQGEENTESICSDEPSNEDTKASCDSIDQNKSESEKSSQEDVVHIHSDSSVNNYDSFNFWRDPLPEVSLDLDVLNDNQDMDRVNVSSRTATENECDTINSDMGSISLTDSVNSPLGTSNHGESKSQIHTASISSVSEESVSHIGSTHVLGQNLNEVMEGVVHDISGSSLGYIDSDSSQDIVETMDEASLAQMQDIVPQSLLESYLGMVDPSRAQTVDTEITKHCAYNLPAVAYTLGRKNWNCIKVLYDKLASDMQWKVRRTLAFSIHEMAIILGDDITHRDLVPVFDGFLKDLDEVKIGVLKHLADFLRLLKPDVRRQYLTKLSGFLNTDNTRNWRFRLELAEQLIMTSELFSSVEISQHLLPICLSLMEDKVSEVRLVAYKLMSAMVKRLAYEDEKLTEGLLNELVSKFAKSNKWVCRQIYVQMCYAVLEDESLPLDLFSKHLLPVLLNISHDPVPNVRLSLSKVMTDQIITREYFTNDDHPQHAEILKTLERLQTDGDRDVRYFANPVPENTSLLDYEDDAIEDIDVETLPV